MSRAPRRVALGTAAALAGASLVALAPPAALAAQPGDVGRFDTWVGYDVGQYPHLAVTGDLDGDGSADVVWGMDSWAPGGISVSLNLGDGTLAPAVLYDAGAEVADLALADLDGDDDLDVVVASQGTYLDDKHVDLFLNDGNGVLSRTSLEAGADPASVALADLDDDGDVDVVVTNTGVRDGEPPSLSGLGVLLNEGDATFAPEVRYPVGRQTYALALADADGDGVLDAIATNHDFEASPSDFLSVLTGNGDGTFDLDPAPQPLDRSVVGSWGWASIDAGDLDGDGAVDLVVGGTSSQHDAVLLGDGTGDFGPPTTYDVFGAVSVTLADVDADDDLDVLSVGGGGGVSGSFTVQRNTGDGTLAAPERGTTSNNPLGLAVADLDRDGRLDLVVANRDTATGTTHLQRPDGTFAAPPAGSFFDPATDLVTADLDGDGDVDVATTSTEGFKDVVRVFLNDGDGGLTEHGFVRWEDALSQQTRAVSAADLDGDGDQDLTWMVSQYGSQRVVQALNTGDATFAAPTARAITTCTTGSFAIADVDADGDLDQVFPNDMGCGESQDDDLDVSISYNDGSATFGSERRVRMAWGVRSVVAADVNGDDHVDLVAGGVENFVGGEPTGDVAVSLGDGTGDFPDGTWTFTGNAHAELAVIDFEGDGDLDVATDSRQDGVTLLTNDGDGAFASTTLPGEYVHGYTNAVGIAVGDVTGDTIPDVVVAHVTGSDVGVHSGFGDGTFEPRQVRYGLRPRVSDVELADLNGDGRLDIVGPSTLGGGGLDATEGATDAGTDADGSGLLVLDNRRPACTITGTPGADVLTGTRRSDVICGLGGDDVIKGRGAGDILRGGSGDDRLVGGDGVDIIDGERGDDRLTGGAGDDRLRGADGADTIKGGKGRDVVDALDGERGNDTGDGGGGRNHCRGDRSDTLDRCD